MVLDFWTYVNPILRILIYLVALISIGTILFNFHFEKYLDNDIKYYCYKILKNNSASGILLSILVFFSIAGNLDFQQLKKKLEYLIKYRKLNYFLKFYNNNT